MNHRICYQVSTFKKGDSSILDYYQKVKSLGDILATIGKPLENYEIISFLLARLDSSYESLITSITTHVDPLSMDDIFSHLFNHEGWNNSI